MDTFDEKNQSCKISRYCIRKNYSMEKLKLNKTYPKNKFGVFNAALKGQGYFDVTAKQHFINSIQDPDQGITVFKGNGMPMMFK